MDPERERLLRQIAKSYLDRGRPGDYEHTLRTIGYARRLLQKEEGEEDIVVTALYLHDIGWSQVDYDDWIRASHSQKKNTNSAAEHMRLGAIQSKGILEELGCDIEKAHTIVSIIAIHDYPIQIFAFKDPSATLVLEADYLDRYGPEALARFRSIFGDGFINGEQRIAVIEGFRKGLEFWFKTQTGKAMALKLARESGIFDL